MTNNAATFPIIRRSTVVLLLSILPLTGHATPEYRSNREYITVNTDMYELAIQKSGAVSVNTIDGMTVFQGAQARVRLAGEGDRFRKLNTPARNAARFVVNDVLGEGQGLVIAARDCEWRLRAYPTRPYFSVQLTYRNNARRPVQVAALSPWYVSDDRRGAVYLGPGASGAFVRGGALGDGGVALVNPHSGRCVVAGFLTHEIGDSYFDVGRDDVAAPVMYSRFNAVCVFDPPVTVAPGETLEAETLYIDLGEGDFEAALARFNEAVARVHRITPKSLVPSPGMNTVGERPDAESLLSAMIHQGALLRPSGWQHFYIGAGWEEQRGDWQPDPLRFPSGFTPILETARELDITLALTLSPFVAETDAAVVVENPDWFAELADSSLKVIDTSLAPARQWLTRLAQRLRCEYGAPVLFLEGGEYLLHMPPESFQDNLTRVQRYRLGVQAIREGLGDGLLYVAPGHPAALPFVDGLSPDIAANRLRASGETDSFVRALNQQRMFLPTGILLDAGPVSPTGAMPLVAGSGDYLALTTTALMGSPLRLAVPPHSIPSTAAPVLGLFAPTLPRAARVVETRSNMLPGTLHLPIHAPAGEWHVVACFNWDETMAATLSMTADALGLDIRGVYTVYEPLTGRYHGLMRERLEFSVPPASVRLFGLRPFEGTPMLIASDRHISQGAHDHRSVEWHAGTGELRGVFRADPIAYTLRFLVPSPWRLEQASVSVDDVLVDVVDELVTLRFSGAGDREVSWSLQCGGDEDTSVTKS